MQNGFSRSVNAALGRLLPERRIFIRSDTATRYLHLTPVAQLGAALLVAGGIGWGVVGGSAYVLRTSELERVALERGAIERAFAARIAALEAERATLAESLETAEHRADAVAEILGAVQERLVLAEADLRAVKLERGGLQGELDRLLAERNDGSARIAELEATLRETRLALLDRGNTAPEPSASGSLPGMVLSSALAELIAERDRAIAERSALDAEVASLSAEIAGWRDRQEVVLARIETAVRTGLDGLTRMMERAEIDVEAILAESRESYSGTGGPFEPLSDAEAAALGDAEGDLRIAALMQDLERVNLLRVAVDRLPFGQPVTGARMTSGFGKRRDPIRKRWSLHAGVDWAGPRGTPIHATAAGVVSFVGRMSGYGNMVVIRHAFGYETRYAHLDRALVKVGDRVGRGDPIAEMGSSGRSTGTHLHYEVRIDADPINPAKFIEAARDVL